MTKTDIVEQLVCGDLSNPDRARISIQVPTVNLDFTGTSPKYSEDSLDDVSEHVIKLRCKGSSKIHKKYSALWLAAHGDDDDSGYCDSFYDRACLGKQEGYPHISLRGYLKFKKEIDEVFEASSAAYEKKYKRKLYKKPSESLNDYIHLFYQAVVEQTDLFVLKSPQFAGQWAKLRTKCV